MPYTGVETFCDTSRLRYTKPGQVVQPRKGPNYVRPVNNEEALMRVRGGLATGSLPRPTDAVACCKGVAQRFRPVECYSTCCCALTAKALRTMPGRIMRLE